MGARAARTNIASTPGTKKRCITISLLEDQPHGESVVPEPPKVEACACRGDVSECAPGVAPFPRATDALTYTLADAFGHRHPPGTLKRSRHRALFSSAMLASRQVKVGRG